MPSWIFILSVDSYCQPCLILGIEASDVSSLLAQFEEAADSAKNTQ